MLGSDNKEGTIDPLNSVYELVKVIPDNDHGVVSATNPFPLVSDNGSLNNSEVSWGIQPFDIDD